MSEKKINGETYKVEPMLAEDAIILQARLMRVVGPAMSKLPAIIASRKDGATEEAKAKGEAEAVAAITGIFANCDPKEIGSLIKDVVETAMILRPSKSYEQVDMNGDFTGKLGNVIPVVFFVLKEQFGDFFSGALASGTRGIVAKG
jgi:hypothetical protein